MKLSRRCRVYDNGGRTADRYTIVTISKPFYSIYSSPAPSHPLGVWGAEETQEPVDEYESDHLGRRIPSGKLPESVVKACNYFFKGA